MHDPHCTKAVVRVVAEAMGGDLFESVPVQSYTSDDLDWPDYDSVFFGCPFGGVSPPGVSTSL